jgi:tetratricopeptide (TPR) repeat protein
MKKMRNLFIGLLLGASLIGIVGCATVAMQTSNLVFTAKNKISEGDLRGSIPLLQKALKVDPNDLDANVTMARVQYLLGHFQKAEKFAKIAHKVDSYDFRALGILGLIDIRQGRFKRGIERVSKAMKTFHGLEPFGASSPVEPEVTLKNMRYDLKEQGKISKRLIEQLEDGFWIKVDWYNFNQQYRKWNFNGFYQDISADGGAMVP